MRRGLVRWLVDFAALFLTFCVTYGQTGSYWKATAAAALLGVYGCWCFYDGIAQPPHSQEAEHG